MDKIGIKAPALGYDNVELISQSIRKKFGITNNIFPIDKLEYLLVFLGCNLCIRNDIIEEGFTSMDGSAITLREDVYNGLIKNEPRCRFTGAHELSHLILHSNNTNMGQCRTKDIKIYCNPEWQANALAGALLCPAKEIKRLHMGCQDIMEKFLVSEASARIRLNAMGRITIL